MKLALKTRDNCREDYLYEVHKSPCQDLKKDVLQVHQTDKFETPEDLIRYDMENGQGRECYKIMNCCKNGTQ